MDWYKQSLERMYAIFTIAHAMTRVPLQWGRNEDFRMLLGVFKYGYTAWPSIYSDTDLNLFEPLVRSTHGMFLYQA